MAEIDCRNFNGYKPCGLGTSCDVNCASYSRVQERVLIVHLEALGAVLRSTSLLSAVKRKYPKSHVTFFTKAPAHHLLKNLNSIDRLMTLNTEDLLKLSALEFDVTYVIDKSLAASAVASQTKTREWLGFRADPYLGAIVPANAEANELWQMGLSDQKKFFENQKSEQQLVHEALVLGEYTRDEYQTVLSADESALAQARRQAWRRSGPIIGLNTGCSPTLPNKKLSVEGHRALIEKILGDPQLKQGSIVLLGGPEDTERNREIAAGLPVIQSPTDKGLRDGFASVEACDLVFTGDSLGMHMAIALKKWTVAWFGPTCIQEIDLYGRGRKLQTSAPCSPCWKRVCSQTRMCYDQVDLNEAIAALNEGLTWHTSFFKPHSQGTSSSLSPF